MSRIFTATATDQSWTNTTDSVTTTAIGLALPNQVINFIQGTYAAGQGIYRIISSTTNAIKRIGFMSKSGYSNQAECMIPAYRIAPDDLLQVYTDIADATANQSNVLALITSSRGVEPFYANNVVDATATELKSLTSNLGIGDLLFGATVTRIAVQEEDAGFLGNITIVDAASGTQFTGYGSQRLPTAGGQSNLTNGVFNVSIGVQKGWTLNCKVTTA